MIAVLFAQQRGIYTTMPNVDVWTVDRDARNYAGPWPVVAHPPCARWGRYWNGGPSARVRRRKGDDDGCFLSALTSVRRWGGVLEHPADSHAWPWFGLTKPARPGKWFDADDGYGWTCYVEQGHYGHSARKGTWLYACRTALPALTWGKSASRVRLDDGFHSAEERRRAVRTGRCQLLSHRQREATPPAFAELLISIASTVGL